jgi:flavin reductase (DIM6/NTAB) family NADH-FMN oxidoreductase RutF
MAMRPVPLTAEPDAQRELRNAFGQFGTGVCVITTCTPEQQLVGITANSFSSVSLDPPLVLWCPAKSARRFKCFSEARHYAVHVMASNQSHIANGFVREANAFADLAFNQNEHGVPLFEGCLARFECKLDALHDAGDHVIIVGRVHAAHVSTGAPLMFQSGAYKEFASPP